MYKKIISLFTVFVFLCTIPAFAINIGTYKTETEYGLLDGFKINWKRKENQKFIEVREESSKKDAERELRQYHESEYERTKFMYDGKAII